MSVQLALRQERRTVKSVCSKEKKKKKKKRLNVTSSVGRQDINLYYSAILYDDLSHKLIDVARCSGAAAFVEGTCLNWCNFGVSRYLRDSSYLAVRFEG